MMGAKDFAPTASRRFAPSPGLQAKLRLEVLEMLQSYETAPDLERLREPGLVLGQSLFGKRCELVLRLRERIGPTLLGSEFFEDDSGHRVLFRCGKLCNL